jgi:hypothetical protein
MKHGYNRVLTREHVMELSRFKSKERDKIASMRSRSQHATAH